MTNRDGWCCVWHKTASLLLVICGGLLAGCHSPLSKGAPTLAITHVPLADPGGPAQMDYIEGRAENAAPGAQVVVYALSGVWWIQPMRAQPYTKVQADSSWKNSTHLGTEYAALLVTPEYHPAAKLTALPRVGAGVLAVATASGKATTPIVAKVVHFSGYDWTVRAAGSDRGGQANAYSPDNAWTDEKGFLHLKMQLRNGIWTCAEVNMNRSLGFGTYRFVVEDSAHLDPWSVMGMFTWDEAGSDETRSELDIELSRWGNPDGKNAQYVVQPFYVPENVSRLRVPAGELTHILRWQPGSASFETVRGAVAGMGTQGTQPKVIGEHTFSSGVPAPGGETVHLDLYKFHPSKNTSEQPAEVVVEKFEYLP